MPIPLRYSETVTLQQIVKTKRENGTVGKEFINLATYVVQVRRVENEASFEQRGLNITKEFVVKTPYGGLEDTVRGLLSNSQENIADYCIRYNDEIYQIIDDTVKIRRV
jgi:hypothetical protein